MFPLYFRPRKNISQSTDPMCEISGATKTRAGQFDGSVKIIVYLGSPSRTSLPNPQHLGHGDSVGLGKADDVYAAGNILTSSLALL